MRKGELDMGRWYSKQDLAIEQLDRAIGLLLDHQDVICAITLAGAAEEILGKILESTGTRNALQERIDEFIREGGLAGEEWKSKHYTEIANSARDALKHYGDGSGYSVVPEMAHEYIERAIDNLERLGVEATLPVKRYLEEIRGE